jgi:predicted nucleic acid-binding Zn ribbon protein
MERAGEFLGKVVRRLGRPEGALAWLTSAWPSIAGPALAAHTRPVRCDANCLHLAADGKPWQAELENMKREICARINQAWGGRLVNEVKFVSPATGAPKLRHEADNDYIPFIRRHRA